MRGGGEGGKEGGGERKREGGGEREREHRQKANDYTQPNMIFC